jgi:hypothetical protein
MSLIFGTYGIANILLNLLFELSEVVDIDCNKLS